MFVDVKLALGRLVKNPSPARGPIAWRAMAETFAEAVSGHRGLLVVEQMSFRPGSPAGDLGELCGVIGALSVLPCVEGVKAYEPRTWKGTVPKKIHQPRILKALTAKEKAAIESWRHDVIDAVGIGLFHTRRMRP